MIKKVRTDLGDFLGLRRQILGLGPVKTSHSEFKGGQGPELKRGTDKRLNSFIGFLPGAFADS